MATLSSCVNTTALDYQFRAACCPSYSSAGYFQIEDKGGIALNAKCNSQISSALSCPFDIYSQPYQPPGQYVYDTTCDAAAMQQVEVSVKKAVFDCTALPVCQISCGGPDRSVVHAVCKSCSCMAEWLANSYAIQLTVALCVYFILNISRVLVIKGIVMITWRSLTKEVFDVRTSCSRRGQMMPEDEKWIQGNQERRVDEDSSDELPDLETDGRTRQISDVGKGIERMLSRFVMKGYICLILGLLLNPAWLIAVMHVQQNIAYKPV